MGFLVFLISTVIISNSKSKFQQNLKNALNTVHDNDLNRPHPDQNTKDELKDCKLNPKVCELVQLIFDEKAIQSTLDQIGYDSKMITLDKLNQKNIDEGFAILKDIANELKKGRDKNDDKISLLSLNFFAIIPHLFGFIDKSIMKITDEKKLNEKIDFLHLLNNMKATKTIESNSKNHKNTIEKKYEEL